MDVNKNQPDIQDDTHIYEANPIDTKKLNIVQKKEEFFFESKVNLMETETRT